MRNEKWGIFQIAKYFNDVRSLLNKTSQLYQSQSSFGEDISSKLKRMQLEITRDDDEAVIKYTKELDRISVPDFNLKVTEEEIKAALRVVPKDFINALTKAKENIEKFHKNQIPKNWQQELDGIKYGNHFTPIETVGLYVPGGRASYPTTVLMNVIPAKLAGVKNLIMVTPPNPEGKISEQVLVAAEICGISEIYKVGGAQAIFALAKGTQSIPKADKIVGPGNIYVTKAKKMVYGLVDIDKPAGPSEVLVYINDEKYANFAASELWAQLEHDPFSSAIAVSEKEPVINAIQKALSKQLPKLKRQEILAQSKNNGLLYLAESKQAVIECINTIASEHLVLLLDDYEPILKQVKNAGSIFCGPYTPVALGDYYAGPNHVLPTDRSARFASPLGVMDFMKYSSWLEYSKESLKKAAPDIKVLTDTEGFDAHYRTIEERIS